jgi:hypothetical protein
MFMPAAGEAAYHGIDHLWLRSDGGLVTQGESRATLARICSPVIVIASSSSRRRRHTLANDHRSRCAACGQHMCVAAHRADAPLAPPAP